MRFVYQVSVFIRDLNHAGTQAVKLKSPPVDWRQKEVWAGVFELKQAALAGSPLSLGCAESSLGAGPVGAALRPCGGAGLRCCEQGAVRGSDQDDFGVGANHARILGKRAS
jgi:hypothetical protein